MTSFIGGTSYEIVHIRNDHQLSVFYCDSDSKGSTDDQSKYRTCHSDISHFWWIARSDHFRDCFHSYGVDAFVSTSDCFFALGVTDCSYRSEEHTSELQSRFDIVCRLLLEKKNSLKILYIRN